MSESSIPDAMQHRIFLIFLILLCRAGLCAPLHASSAQMRHLPNSPVTITMNVRFNGEPISAAALLLDARSRDERMHDMKTGKTSGCAIVFIQGHEQRPWGGYAFLKKLALMSKSGIVVVPVCDTPYGTDPELRGDRGRETVLMAMTAHLLAEAGVRIIGYSGPKDITILQKGCLAKPENKSYVQTELALFGWSHGGLLARRIASSHGRSVRKLAQAAPAGYGKWGNSAFSASCCLSLNFAGESARAACGVFTGQAGPLFNAAGSMLAGQAGDDLRSCSSCLFGNLNFLKLFRSLRNIRDCTVQATSSNFPVSKLTRIAVFFGLDDSLFDPESQTGIRSPGSVKLEEAEAFFALFYSGAVASGCRCSLRVLPGNHLGLIVHSRLWAGSMLREVGELSDNADKKF